MYNTEIKILNFIHVITINEHVSNFIHKAHRNISHLTFTKCRPGSSVCIVTDYGLDGPGLNPGGDEIFRPSRPALGPTQTQ